MSKKLFFTKMNGAGNDFIIIDTRNQVSAVSGQWPEEPVRSLCDRSNHVTEGCDQLLILEKSDKADIFMRIYNADGGEVDACGNATRCIAGLLHKELGRLPVTVATNSAILKGTKKDGDNISVDMGAPEFDWQKIPLALPAEESSAKINEVFGFKNPTFVSMGNPHVVFFLKEPLGESEIRRIGSKIENFTEVFPKRVNVSFAVINADNNNIDAYVWERGSGLTKACGTGACAILAAANKLYGIEKTTVTFINSGQKLNLELTAQGSILLGGNTQTEFEGIIDSPIPPAAKPH